MWLQLTLRQSFRDKFKKQTRLTWQKAQKHLKDVTMRFTSEQIRMSILMFVNSCFNTKTRKECKYLVAVWRRCSVSVPQSSCCVSCLPACLRGLSEELLRWLFCSAGVPPSSLSHLSAFLWQPAGPGRAHEVESERAEGVLAPTWSFYSLV